jgi:hypothetical protein
MGFMQLDKNQTKIRPGLSLHLVNRANDFEETNCAARKNSIWNEIGSGKTSEVFEKHSYIR